MRGQFEFLGVAMPARRNATKALYQNLKPNTADQITALAQALWNYPAPNLSTQPSLCWRRTAINSIFNICRF
nr:DNA alkylation repair protein [uncultured Duganella sp.]